MFKDYILGALLFYLVNLLVPIISFDAWWSYLIFLFIGGAALVATADGFLKYGAIQIGSTGIVGMALFQLLPLVITHEGVFIGGTLENFLFWILFSIIVCLIVFYIIL